MGYPLNEADAEMFADTRFWGFKPPTSKGLGTTHMLLAAGHGEIDALWQGGGNLQR